MKTVTLQWLGENTLMQERDDWAPGDRGPQYESVPGYRCSCGEIIRPGAKVRTISGTLRGKPHFWAECPNCKKAMF